MEKITWKDLDDAIKIIEKKYNATIELGGSKNIVIKIIPNDGSSPIRKSFRTARISFYYLQRVIKNGLSVTFIND